MIACKSKSKEEIKILIDNGADINLNNLDGNTPFMIALENKRDQSIYYKIFN